MGMFRKFLFVLGLFLIALPFLPFNIIPQGSLVGFDILSNNILSIAAGVLLIILAFLSWRRERRMLFSSGFVGPRGPGDAQIMRRLSDSQLRRMQDVQRLRALGA
jgi:hypothetical protein